MKTILVPLDGSALAESILPYVEDIGKQAKAELLLLTALHWAGSWSEQRIQDPAGEEAALALSYLDNKCVELEAKGLRVKTKIVVGPPAEAILESAQGAGVDLIAMSSHGRSGLSRWVMGSVADKVLHGTRLPLLLVRSSEEGGLASHPVAIKKILVPLDGSSLAEGILSFVEELAKAMRASLLLFHVVTPQSLYPGPETVQFMLGQRDLLQELQEQSEVYLAGVAQRVAELGIKVERRTEVGFVVDVILGVASEAGADLIALATHGRSGLGRWIIGSVASAVAQRTTLPCLFVRPGEDESRNSGT